MTAASPTAPRSPTPAGGDLLAPADARPGVLDRAGGRVAAGVYGVLWVAAAVCWMAPVAGFAATHTFRLATWRFDPGTWPAVGVVLTPATVAALAAAIKTARSRLAHRRMLHGGLAVLLLNAMSGGLLNGLLGGPPVFGLLLLALAGAWGRWVAHRGPEPTGTAF